MTSVDLMLEEHRLIERMLKVLEDCAERLDRGDRVPAEMLSGMLAFIQVYADAGHHAKEEDLLFPALAAHGLRAQMDAVDRDRALDVGVARYPAMVAEFEEALLKC